jgi:hypothetical protein
MREINRGGDTILLLIKIIERVGKGNEWQHLLEVHQLAANQAHSLGTQSQNKYAGKPPHIPNQRWMAHLGAK